MLNEAIRNKIIKNSIPLDKYGIHEFAWIKKDAEKLILTIMDENIGILGGDIYKSTTSKLEPLSENWACEPTTSETQQEYFHRSKLESLKYIRSFPLNPDEKILFAIIFTEQII